MRSRSTFACIFSCAPRHGNNERHLESLTGGGGEGEGRGRIRESEDETKAKRGSKLGKRKEEMLFVLVGWRGGERCRGHRSSSPGLRNSLVETANHTCVHTHTHTHSHIAVDITS